jgi:hypothetical protein
VLVKDPAWPSFFPENCPPNGATDASLEVFRLVQSNPPSTHDFQPYAQLFPDKHGGDCKASGLSVFSVKEEAFRLSRRVPAIGRFVAVAKLTPEQGKLMPTPNPSNKSHHTWWAPANLKHSTLFRLVN